MQGHKAGTCYCHSFSSVTCPFFAKKLRCRDKVLSQKHTACMKFSWFKFMQHKAGTKWPQFSILHPVHCLVICPRVQHIVIRQSASCAPACVLATQHHASYKIRTCRRFSCTRFVASQHVPYCVSAATFIEHVAHWGFKSNLFHKPSLQVLLLVISDA